MTLISENFRHLANQFFLAQAGRDLWYVHQICCLKSQIGMIKGPILILVGQVRKPVFNSLISLCVWFNKLLENLVYYLLIFDVLKVWYQTHGFFCFTLGIIL